MPTTPVTYLFDPLCGWCYGASAVLEKLVAQRNFEVRLVPTGLFADQNARSMDDQFAVFAWSNDQRIAGLTHQPFSEAYRQRVLGDRTGHLDSGPATLALTAVAVTTPAREFDALKSIQSARYVDGCDVTTSPFSWNY